ncbi:MOSC domain-containing protein [Rubrivirga sp. IMCC43871]|uniref:MOSC domain-containing protein n=1 Tax=Rubrivirga sp. IMCC43871 TaxID=3391575 RepID=UPI00398F9320
MPGRVVQIFLAPAAGAPVVAVPSAHAMEGRGLEGDRYAAGEGSFSRWPGPARDLTLIAAESLASAASEFGVEMRAGEHRRNVVVEGIDLLAVQGGELTVGEVRLAVVRPCAPCKYLVRVTGQERAFDALVGRGGVRCAILVGGRFAVGDEISVDAASLTRRRHLPG